MTVTIWKNANGTWSHHMDHNGEFASEEACRTDLRFCKEWEGK